MLAMTPKSKQEERRAGDLGDFQFPRSNFGDPIPMVWGTVLQSSPVVLWYGDLTVGAFTESVQSGLFSKTDVVINYYYQIGIDMALCLGPNVTLKRIFCDNQEIWASASSGGIGSTTVAEPIDIDLPNFFGGDAQGGGLRGAIFFSEGGLNEPRDSFYLGAVLDPNVPAYRGISRVTFLNFYIGTSPSVKPFSFEICRFPSTIIPSNKTIMPNGTDCNPVAIVYDCLTNKWGGMGHPTSLIDGTSFLGAANTLFEEEYGMSMMVQNNVNVKKILEECMRVADGLLYQEPNNGLIKIKLIREDFDIETMLVLDESNIIGSLKDFSKTTWESTLNQVRVTFRNRESNYDEAVAVAQDQGNLSFQKRLKSTTVSVPGVKDPVLSGRLANRQLTMLSIPLFKCDFKVNRDAENLRPGDCFVLNWPPYNIEEMVMRVTKIDLGNLTNNEISVSCIQDRFAASPGAFDIPDWYDYGPGVQPEGILEGLVWIPPLFFFGHLTTPTGAPKIPGGFNNPPSSYVGENNYGAYMFLASSPANNSLHFMVENKVQTSWYMTLGANFYLGKGVLPPTPTIISYLSGGYRRYISRLTVTGLSRSTINMLPSPSVIKGEYEEEYPKINPTGQNLFMINDEIFGYLDWNPVGPDTVEFVGVHRSLLDTVVEDHYPDDEVWFLSDRVGKAAISEGWPVVAAYARDFRLIDVDIQGNINRDNALTLPSLKMSNRSILPGVPKKVGLEYYEAVGGSPETQGIGPPSSDDGFGEQTLASGGVVAYVPGHDNFVYVCADFNDRHSRDVKVYTRPSTMYTPVPGTGSGRGAIYVGPSGVCPYLMRVAIAKEGDAFTYMLMATPEGLATRRIAVPISGPGEYEIRVDARRSRDEVSSAYDDYPNSTNYLYSWKYETLRLKVV